MPPFNSSAIFLPWFVAVQIAINVHDDFDVGLVTAETTPSTFARKPTISPFRQPIVECHGRVIGTSGDSLLGNIFKTTLLSFCIFTVGELLFEKEMNFVSDFFYHVFNGAGFVPR